MLVCFFQMFGLNVANCSVLRVEGHCTCVSLVFALKLQAFCGFSSFRWMKSALLILQQAGSVFSLLHHFRETDDLFRSVFEMCVLEMPS